jgi:Fe-S cluster assembly ATP-binding protein
MQKKILDIKNLTVSIDKKVILNNLNLDINESEIHVIMGPNGSGKSTLAKTIINHPSLSIDKGIIKYFRKNLFLLNSQERSYKGIFLAFQYPMEMSGVLNFEFLRTCYNEHNVKKLNSFEFLKFVEKKLKILNFSKEFLYRDLNKGFSGGEKKRNEILQMLLLNPKLILLDELDSGLDIDSVKFLYEIIKKEKKKKSSLLIITHSFDALKFLKPDYLHIMVKGNIIKTIKFF